MPDFLETTVDKFIFQVANDRLYSPDGLWLCQEADRVRVGVTDYLQQLNGDVAFAHLKPVGTVLAEGDEFAEVETIKATVSFSAPLTGTIVETNEELDLAPEAVNEEPYVAGWLVVIDPKDWPNDRAKLLDAESYLTVMRSQAEKELKNL